jgi:hypothetical protein
MTNSDLVYIISFNRIKVVEDSVGNVTGDGLSLVLCILNIVLLSFLLEVVLMLTFVFLPGSMLFVVKLKMIKNM